MVKAFARAVFKHTATLLFLLVVVASLVFWLVELMPTDPLYAYLGQNILTVSPEQQQQLVERWGLNKSPLERHFYWMKNWSQLNFGDSMIYKRPVLQVIGERFPLSFRLMGLAWVFSSLLGYLSGVLGGLYPRHWVNRLMTRIVYLVATVPTFYAGILVVWLFAVLIPVFPPCCVYDVGRADIQAGGVLEQVRHLFLPVCVLTLVGLPHVYMQTREKTLEVMGSDFVFYSRSNGLKRAQIFRWHLLKNTLFPVIALSFANFSEIFGGSLLVEQVFSYPGLGKVIVQAGVRVDLPLLAGATFFSLVFVYSGNFLADQITLWLDPRLREGKSL